MTTHSALLFHQILDNYFKLKGIPAIITTEHNKAYSDTLGKEVHNLKIKHHPDYTKEVSELMNAVMPYSYIMERDDTLIHPEESPFLVLGFDIDEYRKEVANLSNNDLVQTRNECIRQTDDYNLKIILCNTEMSKRERAGIKLPHFVIRPPKEIKELKKKEEKDTLANFL